MKKSAFFSAVLLAAALLPAQAPAQTTLFRSDTVAACYRIPALVTAADGSLVALSDWRPCRTDVGGGRIDVVSRRSADGGQTWSQQTVAVAGGGEAPFGVAHGDAAVVCDRTTGRMLMMLASGNVYYWHSTLDNPNRVGRYYSDDGGLTWWGEEVTADIYGLMGGAVHKLFFSSGRICQSRTVRVGDYYRIYSALCTNVGNVVLYSDDLGATWQPLGGAGARPTTDGDEAKLEELPGGDVLLSSRSQKGAGRIFNVFSYTDRRRAAGSWGEPVYLDKAYPAAKCNGEILVLPARRAADGRKTHLLLLSVPQSDVRRDVGIYWKELTRKAEYTDPAFYAGGWQSYRVSRSASAYSTMVPAADGGVAFFYEEHERKGGYDMVYGHLTLDAVTGGKYTPVRVR